MNVFDNDFDIEEYMQKRLMEIENLESRRIFKETVGKLFLQLHGEIEKEYHALSERIYDEVPLAISGPEIVTNIINRKDYDVTDTYLFPMRKEDLNPCEIDATSLVETLKKKQPFYLYPVFLQADYLKVADFNNPLRVFKGSVKTQHNEYTASFIVRPNMYYRKKIEELYYIFQLNYLPWQSVCCPYLYKLFDVYMVNIENWDNSEIITEARVNFEEYESSIFYEYIPLWNIQKITVKTSTYPEPCLDKINYEHKIFQKKLIKNAKYLITNTDENITNIRWKNGDLIISAAKENPVDWQLYQCNMKIDKKYPNLCISNGRKKTFSDKLRNYYGQNIKTKQEMARLLSSFYVSDFLEFKDVSFNENISQKETYSVDDFIVDELRTGKSRQFLLVDFRAKQPDFYLNRDIMSFLISILQMYFLEYKCYGRLV